MGQKLTKEEFKQKIFDYETSSTWTLKSSLPCIIDFYADWCGPCKMMAPFLDEIAKEYVGKLDVYKVNVDEEQELAAAFQIQSIPTILFVPQTGEPQKNIGALSKSQIVKKMNEVFGITL